MKPQKIEDKMGNKIEITSEGKVILTLRHKHPKSIGNFYLKPGLDPDGQKVVYEKQVKPTALFRKNDSWGLNYSVLDLLRDTDEVVVRYPKEAKVYRLTKAEIVNDYGDFLWFKNEGFEKQIFVPRKHWQTESLI